MEYCPESCIWKVKYKCINGTWNSLLIHGFLLVNARLLKAFGTAFYAITLIQCPDAESPLNKCQMPAGNVLSSFSLHDDFFLTGSFIKWQSSRVELPETYRKFYRFAFNRRLIWSQAFVSEFSMNFETEGESNMKSCGAAVKTRIPV